MQIGSFIDRLAKTRFVFTGGYCASRGVCEERSFEVAFEIGRSDSALVVEGGVRRRNAEPPFSFEIEVPFNSVTLVSGAVHVRASRVGELRGRLQSTRDGFEIVVAGENGSMGSLHLRFFEKNSFEISGMLSLEGGDLSFVARETGHWVKLTSADIVPFIRRRRGD